VSRIAVLPGFTEGTQMKKIMLQLSLLIVAAFVSTWFAQANPTWAQAEIRQSVERKFEEYRTAIKEAQQFDIKNFRENLIGGAADGKPITNYDLGQLLAGIKWEKDDHTSDTMLALELAMDHLERIPDYYMRLERMEWECRSEKLRDM
jgi:hypothetical protein